MMPSPKSLLATSPVMALRMGIRISLFILMPRPRSCLVTYQVMALCMGIQSLQQTMDSKLSNPIRIVSYNMWGFWSGQSFVSVLHTASMWSFRSAITLATYLSTSEEFIVTGVSDMEPDSLIRGRPFGGCAIFYHRKISLSSRSFCAVRLIR